MAERAGFEPAIRFPVYTLSRRAPSTTRPPLQPPAPEGAHIFRRDARRRRAVRPQPLGHLSNRLRPKAHAFSGETRAEGALCAFNHSATSPTVPAPIAKRWLEH